MSKIYIIHENSEWTVHLTNRLTELGLPFEEWHLSEGLFDLSEVPPQGIFYSRMSASSHTRDHRYAPELADNLFAWLGQHGRKVFNGSNALSLELSKVKQYAALTIAGIKTPRTLAAVGKENIIKAAEKLAAESFITKHNRAGKGLGVQLFHSIEALKDYVYGPSFDEPVDGITLIQEYIDSPEKYITRCEFIGGEFFYAVQVDTSGGFELCPADACNIGDLFCPVGEKVEEKPKFQIQRNFNEPIIAQYEKFLKENQITVAGIEFIRNAQGEVYTYDINTNTNYNSDAEKAAKQYGMLELSKFLGVQLAKLQEVSLES